MAELPVNIILSAEAPILKTTALLDILKDVAGCAIFIVVSYGLPLVVNVENGQKQVWSGFKVFTALEWIYIRPQMREFVKQTGKKEGAW